MDFQNRVGGKTGTGGPLNYSESNAERRERLRKLALETVDLAKDPFFMKNHLGIYECRLCLTLHNNEANYLSHTQGKKHQTNLARRAAKEAALAAGNTVTANLPSTGAPTLMSQAAASSLSKRPSTGKPDFRKTFLRDPETDNWGILVMFKYPSEPDVPPEYRIMSAFEQKVEVPNKNFMYLAVAAEPFEAVAVRVPFREVDHEKTWSFWDADNLIMFVQLMYNTPNQIG
jgi:splicing factor 3A subunit 2